MAGQFRAALANNRMRPLDLPRVHHQCIEVWILEQAGVPFDAAPAGLHVVA